MSRFAFVTVMSFLWSSVAVAGGGLSLAFWAGSGAEKDKRVTAIEEHHACAGRRAYAFVTKMPAPGSKGALQPEVVVELSPSGGVIGRWSLPVDEIVLGIRGNQILAPYHGASASEESALFISRDRSFLVGARPAAMPEPAAVACPRIREFGQSAYLRCFEYIDLESKATRHLAYQMPCT